MSKIWTAPKLWEVGNPLTDVEMNAISNNLEWLKSRPYALKEGNTAGNKAIALSTTIWAAIDDTYYTLTLETTEANDDILFLGSFLWSSNGAANSSHFYDILVDDSYYISSGTSTPAAKGKRQVYSQGAAGIIASNSFIVHYKQPTVGVHTYKLRVLGAVAQTVTWYNTSGLEFYFGALDI